MSDPPSPGSSVGLDQHTVAAVYKYAPLPDINYLRRLKLHPETSEQAIVISLDVVPFSKDKHSDYEALSYAWGSQEQPDVIRVDETDGPTISVTRNLATALTYLRRTDEPRTLWIDALCISQADNAEKGPQVAMMGDIYRYATRVVVWLGPQADNSASAMSLMEYLGSQIQLDASGFMTAIPAHGTTDLEISNMDLPLSLWDRDADALLHLLSRPWFSRLWVRQEIHFASPAAVLTYGYHGLSFYKLL